MAISKEDIEHLKDLARVEFNEKAAGKLAKDLGGILGYVETLKEVDVSNVPEMTHAAEGLKNIFRKDEGVTRVIIDKYSTARDLINAFPEKHDSGHGTYLKVKSIL